MKDLGLFERLLSVESVTKDIAACQECITILHDACKHYKNLYCTTSSHNTHPHLIITNYDHTVSKHADIILNGHIDVVPPSQDGQFTPRYEGDRCYARGTGDMKAGVVSVIQVMERIAKEKFDEKRVCLMITSDEETGGYDGVQQLIKQGYTAPVVLIPDGGSIEHIVTSQKGVYLLNGITFTGPGGHASRPRLAKNPIDLAYGFVDSLRTQLHVSHTDLRVPTVTMTSLICDSSVNQIATTATAKVDIRFTEQWTVKQLTQSIDILLTQYHGVSTQRIIGPVVHTDQDTPAIQKYLSVARKYGSQQSMITIEHGASDGRRFAQQGSTVILHRPTCGNIHGNDERVVVEEINTIAEIYYQFIVG